MSNKIALATIQFRADAKGVNPALDALRESSKKTHDEIDRLKEALNNGFKTMKDINGMDFDVAKKIGDMTREAKNFDQSIRELLKGATALESVVNNIRMGEIEQSSRAELKGAIKAAESRKRSVRESDPEDLSHQRELNNVVEEAIKQLNKLDRDTEKVIETVKNGGIIAEATLNKEMKGLREILTLTEKGSDEWKRYNAQLQQIEAHVANIRKQERETASALLSSQDLGQYNEEQIRKAIANGKELLATYKSSSPEAKTLAMQIANAEQYLKSYGVEAARAAAREQEQLRMEQELARTMNKRIRDLKNLSADALGETRRYWEVQRNGAARGTAEFTKAEDALRKIDGYMRNTRKNDLTSILGNPSKYSVSEVKNAVQEVEKMRDSVQRGIPVWHQYNNLLQQGKTYLDNLARTEAAERVERQMQDLGHVSAQGLQEVKKYWEQMVASAANGSTELDTYKAKLREVIAEEKSRSTAANAQRVDILESGNLGRFSETQIRQSIEAGKELIKTYQTASPEAQALARNIVAAEEHLKQYGTEAERTARKEAEALAELMRNRQENDTAMRKQLYNTKDLSDSALRAQEQYWQKLIDDPKTATESLDRYKKDLERVHQLQEQMALTNRKEQSDKLLGGSFGNMSEGQIRAAITAAREYQQTLKTSDKTYKDLSKAILNAEEHIKKYGIEAERTQRKEAEAAQKREEAHRAMEDQLRRGSALSQSALKQQESYWQRLIDDPKAAAAELARYYDNLNKVHAAQKEQADSQVKAKGVSALSRFRADADYENKSSSNQLKEDASALKAYRDSLPKEGNLSLIREIDYYIGLIGQSARGATQSVMSLADAEALAGKVGVSGFSASTDQLKAAKKALEEAQNAAGRGTKRFSELQAAINKIDLELSRTGELSAEVQAVLDHPKGKSFNELKQAVEQGRKALNNMRTDTKEGKEAFDELADKVREADSQMKQLGNTAKGSASAFDKAWSRLKTYITLYVGAAVAMQKLTHMFGELMELSDKMGEVRKTTGFTADEVGRLSENLKKMDVRTSLTSLMEISASAGQLGLKTIEDVEGFTEAANKLMIALPEMGREAATEMMRVAIATGEVEKIRKQLQEGVISGSSATAVAMEKIASTIDRLRASSASTAPEITDFVKRVGAVGAQSGISIDQIAALGSTVSSLGMRVEMSATALSRMIPAIRRNAFDVAHAIGMAPEALRKMFDEAGGGMNAMLAIFRHIKESGMDEDSVEKMLGIGDMADIMKELNQQGARAGIVFAGLSQNVEELERQLGISAEAYEKNVAIQQEFDKMNETTAAKWERLKNQLEEAFVTDSAQRFFGGIIDSLRWIADFITGNVGPVLKTINVLMWSIAAAFGVMKLGLGEGIFVSSMKGLKSLKDTLHYALLVTKDYIVYSWKLATTFNAQERAAIKAAAAQTGLNKAMMANVWVAVIAAIGTLIYKIWEWNTALSKTQEELARMSVEEAHASHNLNNLMSSLKGATKAADNAKKKHEDLKNETESLRREVDTLSKSSDKSADAHGRLGQKTEELEKKEKALKAAEDESNKVNGERLKLINEINSKYSTYLGYMLTEAANAEKVASAHQLIIAAMKEEMRQKGIARKQQAIEDKYSEKEKKYSEKSWNELDRLPRQTQQRIMDAWTAVSASVTSEFDSNGKQTFKLSSIPGLRKSGKTFDSEKELKDYMKKALEEIVRKEVPTVTLRGSKAKYINFGTDEKRNLQSFNSFIDDIWGGGMFGLDDGFGDWAATTIEKQGEIAKELREDRITRATDHRNTVTAAVNDINTSFKIIASTTTGNQDLTARQVNTLAENVNAIVVDLNKYGKDIQDIEKYVGKDKAGEINDVSLENVIETMFAGRSDKERKLILKAAQRASRTGTGGGGGHSNPTYNLTGTSPWGPSPSSDSTDYGTWDVNELVARRNQMDKFKNILKPGTDVRAVLAEDKALMKALDNGLKADWKSVLDWYNQERLKIQKELKSERFSTNQGHWYDDNKSKKRRNPLYESDYALAELERYYARRKESLEKARQQENMTEEMFNREAELLEQEHLRKRSDLRKTFTAGNTEKEKQEVTQFRKWWEELEKKGELDDVPWATVESEWSKATAAQIGRNNLKAQQDLTQLEAITVRHLNQIAKIIDKERPYDGIIANLRDNLTRMDILFADMNKANAEALEKGDGRKFNEAYKVNAGTKRLKFLLTEAETAYSSTIEDVLRRMADNGMTAWADEIRKNPSMRNSLMAQLQAAYDEVQNAIKKESSQIKKQMDIWWNYVQPGDKQSTKGGFEQMLSNLGLTEDRVKRANQLIGAGHASERVADKLAVKQMQIRLQMQETYYNRMRQMWAERIASLREQGKELDAQHAEMSRSLSLAEEQGKLDEQRVDIAKQLEESDNHLYQDLKGWGDLLSSSLLSVFEASNAGNAEYYNERAKMNLTGKGGPGAGTYMVIDNSGTSDASAHYEYLNEQQALERQHEIEQQNALAEAWSKIMDDINMKMSDSITDWMNSYLQNRSIDVNTAALGTNTYAINALTSAIGGKPISGGGDMGVGKDGVPNALRRPTEDNGDKTPAYKAPWQMTDNDIAKGQENMGTLWRAYTELGTNAMMKMHENMIGTPGVTPPWTMTEESMQTGMKNMQNAYQGMVDASSNATDKVLTNQDKIQQGQNQTDKKIASGAQSAFAKMTAAANLYGIAYQAMSNDNLSTAQKFEMIAVQAAGQAAISALTASLAQNTGQVASDTPAVASKAFAQLGPIGGAAAFAAITALLGGLVGLAVSKIAKSKSQIAQATGASVGSGRLATGMLTYAEGNVNEFTDPSTLTPGRQYNVDGADGNTYRARYMGKNPRTHITNGPEFHLVGEAGREAIIDARTTRLLQMNDNGIWQSIQTLYNGGRISSRRRGAGRGVKAFASGNLDDFGEIDSTLVGSDTGMNMEQIVSLQASIDRQNDLLEDLRQNGIKATFNVYGKGGLVDSYDTGKKNVTRHGERY